ncbi:MAG TPA: DnaJ C-terminal domain-containing protein [Methylophilaceae bacterium]
MRHIFGAGEMEFKDYYQTLGVEKSATPDEIKQAYRKLARKYHPDVSKEPNAEERMKQVNEANEVLSDPEKRATYDQLGSRYKGGQEFQPPPDWGGGFDFSSTGGAGADDFSDFFANLFGQSARSGGPRSYQMRGEDQHAKLTIDLRDAYEETIRSLTLSMPETDEQGRTAMKQQTLKVRIPKGVKPGQHIRLAGKGSPGSGGGAAGDLYLEVNFKPDPQYRVDGRDVFEIIAVTPWECALGATIEVPTPTGSVQLKVPAGSQTGNKLRLKERGIPGNPAGDLYIVLKVELPPADTDQARKLYETMAQELAFDPRRKVGG